MTTIQQVVSVAFALSESITRTDSKLAETMTVDRGRQALFRASSNGPRPHLQARSYEDVQRASQVRDWYLRQSHE